MNPYQPQGSDYYAGEQYATPIGHTARPSPPPLQHPHPTHPPVSLPETHESSYYQGYTMPQNDFGMATQLGMQFGRTAMMAGNQYVQKNMHILLLPISNLKYYFNVSNRYVVNKLAILLFPFRHKPWSRMARRSEENGQLEGYRPPREDINAPDLYIPVMSFVTYILIIGVIMGQQEAFHPELLGLTASTALGIVACEVLFLKFGCYLLNIATDVQFLDLIAYCGYKFVGVIITLLTQLLIGGSLVWLVFGYTVMAIGFFLLRSLRYVVLPDASISANTVLQPQRKRRVHFLFTLAALQLVSMWLLLL